MPGLNEQLAGLWRRARFYVRRDQFERELAEEMKFHMEMKARAHEAAGMTPDEAHWAARRQFGNASRLREETGEVMAVGWVDAALQDARYAIRSLRKSPAFTVVAVASLALGIGATTAVFTLVNAVLLRPLPFPDPERLVITFQTVTPGVFFAVDSMPWTYQKYLRLREMVPAFENAGFSTWDDYNLRRTGVNTTGAPSAAERVRAELVETSLFSTLGARALLGRTIGPADSVPSATGAVAVLSEALWRRQFGADSGVLGTTAVLDQLPVTIVGVMPSSFTGIREGAEMWVPLKAIGRMVPRQREALEGGMGTVIARLKPGVSLATANAQIVAATKELNAARGAPRFGPRQAKWSSGAIGLAESRRHPLIRPLLAVLSVAVGGVMLIVCANIAGLLLARARARESELGVRIALGAGRGRLVRQLLTESAVLAALGAVPGVIIAYFGATMLARLRPTLPPNFILLRGVDLLQGASLAPDWRVLSFVTLLTMVVGLVFGAAPALAASRTSVGELIKVAANRGGTTRARGRRALVVGQVALATMLLVGAGLMIRSFVGLLGSDIGFSADRMVLLRLSGGESASATRERRLEMLARIAALPGVDGVASTNCMPFSSDCTLMPLTGLDGRQLERDEFPPIEVHAVSRGFLQVMRTPLSAGRAFDSRETLGERTAVMVNETAARLLWRGEPAVGRRVAAGARDATPMEVIGVVADVKYDAIDAPSRPAFYFDGDDGSSPGGTVIVARTHGNPSQVMPAIRRVIGETDPTVAIHGLTTGSELLGRATSSTRFVTVLLTGFAIGAALLAALGVYGVLAFLVTQRRREFGVRMAIGAPAASVLAMVVRQGAWLTVIGLALGVVGALAATRLLRTFLFDVEASDIATYGVTVALVAAAGILAALLPARCATQVDPAIVLRE